MTGAGPGNISDDYLLGPPRVPGPEGRARRGRAATSMLMVLGAVALVTLPVLVGEFPRELARWYAAASVEAALNNDHARAVAHLDQAIAWNPEDPTLYLVRAQYKLETQQWASGLEDCDRALQLAPDALEIGLTRAQLLQHLGRHEAAIEEYKEQLRRQSKASPAGRAGLLNALAYGRAVGKRELPEGLQASEESLQIVTVPSALLDPGGYLCYARGYSAMVQQDMELALTSLNEAVRYAEAAYNRSVARWKSLSRLPRGSKEYEEQVAVLRPHLLGILTLRAQLLDEMEQPDNAAKDRERIESLTPGGNHSLDEPINLFAAIARVRQLGSYLDTRGFLHYQLGDLQAANRDLQRAVEICQWASKATPWELDAKKHLVRDIREFNRDERQWQMGLAVIYYHRMLVREALGQQEAAAEDRARVVELGYEPGEHLF